MHTSTYTRIVLILIMTSFVAIIACKRPDDISREEAELLQNSEVARLLEKIVDSPGPLSEQQKRQATYGGSYSTSVQSDPTTFNPININDGDTGRVNNYFRESLFEYNAYERTFVPNIARFEVIQDLEEKRTKVRFYLNDNLYWTTKNGLRIPITMDDLVFWYDSIIGNPEIKAQGYASQFIQTPEGNKERIELQKEGQYQGIFIVPTLINDPVYFTNMEFGPRYLFEPALKNGGPDAVRDVLSVDTDPRDVPSMGEYMLVDYQIGQRLEYERNPDYWRKDRSTGSDRMLPFVEKVNINIIPSEDTEFLLFTQGKQTGYNVQIKDLDTLLNADDPHYNVYTAGFSKSSFFITFNQNPSTVESDKLRWFTNKHFRQAMSMLMPRQRIVDEIYRGLGRPAHGFATIDNPLYDPSVTLKYTYNPQRAVELLKDQGFRYDSQNRLVDEMGTHVEFDFFVGESYAVGKDMVNLYATELEKVGITMHVRPIDFQTLVERITNTYNWDAIIVVLGVNSRPNAISSLWLSSGIYHLWHPKQETPHTAWEARIDELYYKGLYTLDEASRRAYYNEYQELILEELPVIYVAHTQLFVGFDKAYKNIVVDDQGYAPQSLYRYFSDRP